MSPASALHARQLGPVAFDTEWQIGANLSAEDVVRDALAQRGSREKAAAFELRSL